jgi:uncharacterized membrane protein YedE/YeeE
MDFLYKPWPWYVAGPIIGFTVPLLLLMGNKRLGISSTLRHICAACVPASIPLFNYDWKKEAWNLFFVGGVLIGGVLGGVVLSDGTTELMPREYFNWSELGTLRGILMMIVGGFMVGFGTRYARGCTSGHGITGLSALQWPSLIATMSFFLGGIVFTYLVLPYVLAL